MATLTQRDIDLYRRQVVQSNKGKDQPNSQLVSNPTPVPPWQRGLQTVNAPFDWISRNITQPFGAVVTSGFTPSIPGTEDLPWLERERAEYEQWKEPEFTMPWGGKFRPTKGIVESLPWLAVPSAGGIIGRAAGIGTKATGLLGVAAKGGAVGKAAQIGATALKPVATVEALPGKALSKMVGIIDQAKITLPEQKLLNHKESVARLGQAMGELEKGEGEQAYINFMSKLVGEKPKVSFTPVGEAITKAERDELFNMMKTAPLVRGYAHATGDKALRKVFDGVLPNQSELDVLEKAFGSELVTALMKKIPPNRFAQVLDIANAPRAVLSAVDLSGLLRQGAVLTARRPVEASKTVLPMLKAFLSDKNASLVDDIIMSRPHTGLALDSGLYLAPLPAKGFTALNKMEESFMSRFIDRVPVIGSVVRASNRAYVTVLNDLRSRTFESTVSMWEKLGANELDYKELARFINAASGRGSLPKVLRGASPILNATLFSPRLLVSRLELPYMLASKSPLVRKEAARTLAQFLGIGSSLVGLATLAGAKTNLDPRSSDFGKIIVGSSRLDIWAGYAQWGRFVAQLTSGQRKTAGGDIRELNRREVVDRFLTSKFSPAYGLLNDVLRGESYMGEEVSLDTESLRRQAVQRLAPLFIQDMIDAIEQEGLAGGMIALPSMLGIGVTTYMSPVQKIKEELAQDRYGMTWEEVGKNFGNLAQRELEQSSPELQQLDKEEQEKYAKTITGKADVNNRYRIETNLVEDRFKKSIDLATQEFRATGDGTQYRVKINTIMNNRREQYDLLSMNPDYAKITDYYNRPLTQEDIKKMSPKDVARRAYNEMMYGDQMYDQFGNYQFDLIDAMRQQFVAQFGQEMFQYVEDYQGIKQNDMPPEYDMLKQAQAILKPYWQVENQIWSQFPPQMEEVANQIDMLERTDKIQAKRMLFQYPQIVYARKQIALMKKQIKLRSPEISQALAMFYSY